MNECSAGASCCFDFEVMHDYHTHPVMRSIERGVVCCDYGGTSSTTRPQADTVPAALELGRGTDLLEIGAGTGWPSLYLSRQTGCQLTLLDIPLNALQEACNRAGDENVANRVRAVSASATAMPFPAGSFDTIGHSDVLCCLPEKREMLAECRRVATANAKMHFFVIAPAQGLSEKEMDIVIEAGPPFIWLEGTYEEQLEATGWNLLEKTDLTDQYRESLHLFRKGLESHEHTLREVMAAGDYEEQMIQRKQQVEAIEQGLMIREMYLVEAI
jgi:SAM-dependent methyltransferase